MSKNKAHLHALNLLLSPIGLRKMLTTGVSPKELWDSLDEKFLEYFNTRKKRIPLLLKNKNEINVELEFEKIEKSGLILTSPEDENYPPLLREIEDKPALLYVKTEKSNLKDFWNRKTFAVVGPRYASPYGKEITELFVPPLARSEVIIVSGLAKGIDGAAHSITLRQGGTALAVLGHGLNFIYPPEHRNLAQKILQQNGALISEYPPETEPMPFQFPERNRIIAGLCHGLFIPEASEKSGGLITANLALDYNREVFTVPGNITNYRSKGSNSLLKQGAHPVTSPNDIFEILNWKPKNLPPEKNPALTNNEKQILSEFRDKPLHLNSLIEKTQKTSSQLSQILLQLELKGLLQNPAGNWYKKSS